MSTYNIPLIEDLTLSYIGDLICANFDYRKEHLGSFIFQSSKTFQRKAHQGAKISKTDVDKLITNMTNKLCDGDKEIFYALLKEWFPSLQAYDIDNKHENLRNIFIANLMRTSSPQNFSTPSILDNTSLSTVSFFQSCLEYTSPIKCLKISLLTGWNWFRDNEKLNLLTDLANKGVTIFFIGNPMSSVLKNILLAMRNPDLELRYGEANATLSEWHKYETAYPNIHLHISTDYPILHQSYIVEFSDGSERILLRDYTYGTSVQELTPRQLSKDYSPDYSYYKNEFQFLWNRSIAYDEWKRSLPPTEETLPIGDYILIYPSHQSKSSDNLKWIYCKLSIKENNIVSMLVNISNINAFPDCGDNWEYAYTGKAKLTKKIIYITLHGNEQEELRYISIPIPIRNFNRYIGLMSALTPSGIAPIAFKFACIDYSLLSKINYPYLHALLSNNSQTYPNSLTILEPYDIEQFYSNSIFL